MKGEIRLFMNGEQIRYRTWQKKSDRRQYIKEWKEMISKSKHKFDIQIKITDYGKDFDQNRN